MKQFYPYTVSINTSSMGLNAYVLINLSNKFVLAYDNDTYLNRVNSSSNHEMMNNFLKAIYKENMMCYCVTKENFMKLKDTYMLLRSEGRLPAPKKVDFGENEKKVDEGLEFGKKIFGDFLQIKEE